MAERAKARVRIHPILALAARVDQLRHCTHRPWLAVSEEDLRTRRPSLRPAVGQDAAVGRVALNGNGALVEPRHLPY